MRSSYRSFTALVLLVAYPLAADPIKIMPVGDSITAGEHYGFPALEERTGYRKPLFEMRTAAGYAVDFVGSQDHPVRCEDAADWYGWNCGAYPGRKIPEIADRLEFALPAWPPDILLVHVGTNGNVVLVDMEHGAGLDYSDRLPNPEATPSDAGGDMLGTRYPGVPLDRYHPNEKGNTKMARKFCGELVRQLGEPPGRVLPVPREFSR